MLRVIVGIWVVITALWAAAKRRAPGGTVEKVRVGEKIVAVVLHSDGTKDTYEANTAE